MDEDYNEDGDLISRLDFLLMNARTITNTEREQLMQCLEEQGMFK